MRRRCARRGKVDARLPGKGNSNSHGARPVHLTSGLSIKKSTEGPSWGYPRGGLGAPGAVLEPFRGYLSPKVDEIFQKWLLIEVSKGLTWGGGWREARPPNHGRKSIAWTINLRKVNQVADGAQLPSLEEKGIQAFMTRGRST